MEPAHTESVISPLPAPRRRRDCEPKYRVSAFEAVASERLCDAIARHISPMTTRQATVAIGDGHSKSGTVREQIGAIKARRHNAVGLRRLMCIGENLKLDLAAIMAGTAAPARLQ